MQDILLKNADYVLTMNHRDEILCGADILICGNEIIKIGFDLPIEDVQVIDMRGKVVLPGFVNTHHHLYQTLFRGIASVQEKPLFPWLQALYEYWKLLDETTVRYGSLVGFCELIKTGCTTTTDHHYVFPKNSKSELIDVQFQAASALGIRFHATRGSMSLGKDKGGLPPVSVVQTEDEILLDSERLIKTFHDKSKFSMNRVALAPCSPFSVTPELMRQTAILAKSNGVMMHTHLAETLDEENFCVKEYKLRPVELMDSLGWLESNAWFAHCIFLSDIEIAQFKLCGAAIAHCPSSNMKLGSGICRTSELYNAGVKFGIGVDGSASNDGSNMLEEVRRAYLLNHLLYAENGLSAYQMLKIATAGGAGTLGRNDVGRLLSGMAADIIALDINGVEFAGCHDVCSAIVCCGNTSVVDFSMINGKVVMQNGRLLTIDEREVRAHAHEHAIQLVGAHLG